MIRVIEAHEVINNEVMYYEFSGTSTDTKPTNATKADSGISLDIATGSLFHEVDTTKIYSYDEDGDSGSEWVEQVQLGGS